MDRSGTGNQPRSNHKFFESITCQYGVPNNIITDNGSNFISNEF
jgi:hypothetical protein